MNSRPRELQNWIKGDFLVAYRMHIYVLNAFFAEYKAKMAQIKLIERKK